jgi:hypothetical protein
MAGRCGFALLGPRAYGKASDRTTPLGGMEGGFAPFERIVSEIGDEDGAWEVTVR